MEVIAVDTIKEFDALKADWNNIYTADKHATVFVSWDFLRGWIAVGRHRWTALGVRSIDRKHFVAFLLVFENDNGSVLCTCDRSLTDHTSFLCEQGYERDSIKAIAKFIQDKMNWQQLRLFEVMDPRIDLFLDCFSTRKYHVRELEKTICPYIPLGKTWDGYLLERLSRKARKKLRKCLREIEKQEKIFVTNIQPDNAGNQIETLIQLRQMKWGKVDLVTIDTLRSIFRYCFENNHLFLPILWSGNKPVSASVAFVDHQKKCLYAYISGWDDTYKKLSPGTTLKAFCIRYAIENKFEGYDFLRGDEAYKYTSFGSINRYNRNILIEKKSLRSLLKKLKYRVRRSVS